VKDVNRIAGTGIPGPCLILRGYASPVPERKRGTLSMRMPVWQICKKLGREIIIFLASENLKTYD